MSHVNKQMVSFFLTTKCNLRCIYCYNCKERTDEKVQTLPLYIAKAGIDYFFRTNSSRHIRFYGPGEPTQAFNLMKEIVVYAKKKAENDLTIELQTNGAFSEKVCEYIYDNINIVWISMDGTQDIQNHNRPLISGSGSAKIVERNVRKLSSRKITDKNVVGIRVTITNDNINRQIEMIDYFSSLGVKHIWNDPVFPEVGKIPYNNDLKRVNEFSFNYDLYVDKYLEAYHYAKDKGIFYGSFLTINFYGKSEFHCRACTPVPHFTTDGYVTACDLVTFGELVPSHMRCFVYGQWSDSEKKFIFDIEKINKLQTRCIYNMKHCKECSVAEHCGGYCLGETANETGSFMLRKPKVCQAIQRLYSELHISKDENPFFHP